MLSEHPLVYGANKLMRDNEQYMTSFRSERWYESFTKIYSPPLSVALNCASGFVGNIGFMG